MSDTNLAVIEPQGAIVPLENPGTLMRHATDVAGVCREIVLKTASTIQGRKFVRVEGWQSIATAHGCCLSVESIEEDEHGNVTAWAAVRRMSDGVILARAQGYVGMDEKTWNKRDRYARRAMCQTRAMSRVARSAFAHVVVLIDANLSTTPAEEMPHDGEDFEQAKPAKPAAYQQSLPKIAPITTVLAPAPVTFRNAAERKARLDALLLKSKLKLVSDLEKGDPHGAIEFMQKAGQLMPNETALSEANELTLFPSVPQAPDDRESDGDWWARVNEAIARDAQRVKASFEDFRNGSQIPDAEVVGDPAPEPGDDIEPVPVGALHLKIDVCSVSEKSGSSAKGPWTLHIVRDENGNSYTTFDKKIAAKAKALSGQKATIFFAETAKGLNLHKIIPA